MQADARRKIARTYPVPLAFGQSTLFLDLPTQLVARNGDEVRIFESADENKCGGQYEFLCLLPVHTAAHIKVRDCLITLLGSPTVAEVQSACHYTQINTTKPHVTSLPDGVFSIAHLPRGASIQCIQKTTKTNDVIQNIARWGNVEVRLPCKCVLTAGGQTLASNRFPCSTGLVDEPELRTVVPAEWMLGAVDFPHPVRGGVSLALPNLTEEIMPLVKQLDEAAPKYINNSKSELEFSDEQMEKTSLAYQIHQWRTKQFPWSDFLMWVVMITHSALIAFLLWDYGCRVRNAAIAAAAAKAIEHIPMTAAATLRSGPLICVLPESVESTLYFILFLVILLTISKIWRLLRGCLNCCISCLTMKKVRQWLFNSQTAPPSRPLRGPSIRVRSPEHEAFEHIDDTTPVFVATTTSSYNEPAVISPIEEEVPRSAASVARAPSFVGPKGRGTNSRPPTTHL